MCLTLPVVRGLADKIPSRAFLASVSCLAALVMSPRLAHPAPLVPAWFVNETVVTNLREPNSMAFLPDGRLLFTEQYVGRVRMLVHDHIAATDPVLVVPNLQSAGYERGLQGIAVDPRWPAKPFVYLYYNRTGGHNVLARYTAQGDIADSSGENLTLQDPMFLIDDVSDSDPNHNAGCLRFAPDSTLFLSIGEDEDFCAAYDSTSLKGQLLRIAVDQLPDTAMANVPRALITPVGNPLSTPDSNAALVWAYGMRNPWRFHIDPATGLVYLADVGEVDFEEVNEVKAGEYLGWPYREGNRIMRRLSCPEPGGEGSSAYTPPIVAYPHNPHDTAIYTAGVYHPVAGASHNWPSSHWGDLFYGEFFTGVFRRLKNVGGTWVSAPFEEGQPDSTNWATGMIGAVDFQIGPDGSLWWMRWGDDDLANDTGSIERLRYVGVDTTLTATEVALVHTLAAPDHVSLEWYVADSGLSATLYRRTPGGSWQSLAELLSDGTGHLRYEDRSVVAGQSYDYRLGVRENGVERFFGGWRVEVPSRFELAVRGIRPQPGGGRVFLAFSIPRSAPVRLEFLDVAGRRVLSRDLGALEAGNQLLPLTDLGLASGVYVARIVQDGRSATAKAVLTR